MTSLLIIGALVPAGVAQASLSNVSSTTLTISGKNYFHVTATMNGPPTSPYVVPLQLLYPVNPAESNGTAIVDFLNQTPMRLRAFDTGGAEYQAPAPLGRILVGDAFIADHGYVYAAIQWDREMIPFINLHEGTAWSIPSEVDQIAIAFDVGSLLRQPPAGLPGTLNASQRIATGYSASTGLLQTILHHPVLHPAFAASFNGVLLVSTGRLSKPWPAALGIPAGLGEAQGGGTVKTILVNTETDLQFMDGRFLRGESSNYRIYEIAGASHNPTNLVPMSQFVGLQNGPTSDRQNPLSIGPVARAMMEHLRSWTLGIGTPPPGITLGNPFNTHNHTDFTPASSGVERIWEIPRSASDGNALGGVRLPPVVVPIGLHNGVETNPTMPYTATTLGQLISGTFEVYSPSELAFRYPSHGAYVQAVTTAAHAAFGAGWILASDRDAYIATAQASAVGNGLPLTPAEVQACFEL